MQQLFCPICKKLMFDLQHNALLGIPTTGLMHICEGEFNDFNKQLVMFDIISLDDIEINLFLEKDSEETTIPFSSLSEHMIVAIEHGKRLDCIGAYENRKAKIDKLNNLFIGYNTKVTKNETIIIYNILQDILKEINNNEISN